MTVEADWKPIETAPAIPMAVIFYFGTLEWKDKNGDPCILGPLREMVERVHIGWWDGESWFEGGTGHEVFESWREQEHLPTHWAPLAAPPDQGDA